MKVVARRERMSANLTGRPLVSDNGSDQIRDTFHKLESEDWVVLIHVADASLA
jgi:hypothetical protein